MSKNVLLFISFLLLTLSMLCRNAFAALPPPQLEAKFSNVVPVIDGSLGGAEWNDTRKYEIVLTNGTIDIDAWLYVKHNSTHIHFGLLLWSIYTHSMDEIIIAFDEGDDGSHGSGSRDWTLTPLQEDLKTVVSDHTLGDGYYNTSWYSKSTEIDFDADLIHETDHTTSPSEIEYWEGLGWVDDHWECEFSIPFIGNDAGTSDVSDLSCNVTDKIGIKIQYYYPFVNCYYPAGDKIYVNTYADLSFPTPLIESCDSSGAKKDNFNLFEDVRANGSGFLPNTTYDFYLVEDVETWTDGMAIPSRVPGTATSITSDDDGVVLPVVVWSDPSTVGAYDIIVDVNMNGLYDEGIDALDNDDVGITAGFVIPEFSAFILLLFQITTLTAFIFAKKHKH
ncbi:MAG: hypothetical protein QHH17_02920 [Candidatus Bathyarchaeota archaeon]|nr:hypothetical protein [Candidatus Bathyarchaeota archaeon]